MLFQGVSFSQENNSLKQSDTTNNSGKFALDIMSWISYTMPYTTPNSYSPKTPNKHGGYTSAFIDVAYRFRATYKLKRFRVGLDFSFKEITIKEELSFGMMTNGFQTMNITTDYTFLNNDNLDIGGYFNFRIYHNRFNEDIQNDLLQVGLIGTYHINSNISVLVLPGFGYNSQNNGIKNSLYINAGLRLNPSKTDLGINKINRNIYFSIAITCHNNLTKQNLELLYKGDRFVLYPYRPVYDGIWNENENNYKNAFATTGHIFPVFEFGVSNKKMSSHIVGAGYSSVSDSANLSFLYTDQKEKTILQNIRVYYQYNQTIFRNLANNYSKCSVYPYLGGQITMNFKKSSYSWTALKEDCNFQHYNDYGKYSDSSLLVTPQFLIGLRSNHNNLFFDAGICFNLIARAVVNSDVWEYTSNGYSSSENFELHKTIYIGDLWKNHLFADNIYFKLGYRF